MKTLRLLTIGNSFSQNALAHLEAIAASAGAVAFHVGCASLGGCSLEKHWNLARYTEREPAFKTYHVGAAADGAPCEATLQEALTLAPWDVVTLQQVSHKSFRRETFEPWLGKLHGLVTRLAPQARVMLHQTWAYRSDSPFLPENGLTQSAMAERIIDNYAHFSAVYGCGVLPSGKAVARARACEGAAFRWPDPDYEYQRAEAPALPAQPHSFAVGWHWQISNTPDGIPRLSLDANHLNTRGCYLAGCVWYSALTGLDVTAVSYVPPAMDAADAAWLRAVAQETVQQESGDSLRPPLALGPTGGF